MLGYMTTHDPASIKSVVGIIYLLVLLAAFFAVPKCSTGKRVGVAVFILNLAIIGIFWVGASTPDVDGDEAQNGYAPYVEYEGEWVSERELVRDVWSAREVELYWDAPRVYKMHIDGISPYFYHPASLYWSPLIAFILILFYALFIAPFTSQR